MNYIRRKRKRGAIDLGYHFSNRLQFLRNLSIDKLLFSRSGLNVLSLHTSLLTGFRFSVFLLGGGFCLPKKE